MTPMPRFHCPSPLATGAELDLPARVARHVQVLRLQPGDGITLFHGGQGGEFDATVLRMGPRDVRGQLGAPHPLQREPPPPLHPPPTPASSAKPPGPCTCSPASWPTSAWTGWWKKPPNWAPPASRRC